MNKKTETWGLIFLFIISVLVSISYSVSADTLDVYPNMVYISGNENYSVSTMMSFSTIVQNESWIRFNNTDFNVSSTNPINITVSYVNSNISAASEGDTVLKFTADTSGGNVRFNLSGFTKNKYSVTRDDGSETYISVYTPESGVLSFWNNEWSENTFTITKGDISPTKHEPDLPPSEPDPVSLIIYVECNGEPIDQAKVTVDNVDKITGSAGRVTYSLIPDVYTILVFNPLYGEMSEVVDLTESKTVTITYDQETEDDSKSIPGFEFFVFGIGFLFVISFFYYRKKQSL